MYVWMYVCVCMYVCVHIQVGVVLLQLLRGVNHMVQARVSHRDLKVIFWGAWVYGCMGFEPLCVCVCACVCVCVCVRLCVCVLRDGWVDERMDIYRGGWVGGHRYQESVSHP